MEYYVKMIPKLLTTSVVKYQCSKYLFSDLPLCVREGHRLSGDVACKQRRSLPSLPPSAPPPLPVTLRMHRPTSACGKRTTELLMWVWEWRAGKFPSFSLSGVFQSSHEAPPSSSLDAGPHGDSTVNYVNIPISLLTAKTRELLYTELDLQRPGSAPVSSPRSAVRGNTSHLYRPNTRACCLERTFYIQSMFDFMVYYVSRRVCRNGFTFSTQPPLG